MGKLLPVLMALVGLAGGSGAGYVLRPEPDVEAAPPDEAGAHDIDTGHGTVPEPHGEAGGHGAPDAHGAGAGADPTAEFVKLNNQFVIPVVENGRVSALVVVSLSLEVEAGSRETVYQLEPKFRDSFLRVMFDHANSGGFRGVFTASTNMTALRLALLEAAQTVMGPAVRDVLIIDLVRQDS